MNYLEKKIRKTTTITKPKPKLNPKTNKQTPKAKCYFSNYSFFIHEIIPIK